MRYAGKFSRFVHFLKKFPIFLFCLSEAARLVSIKCFPFKFFRTSLSLSLCGQQQQLSLSLSEERRRRIRRGPSLYYPPPRLLPPRLPLLWSLHRVLFFSFSSSLTSFEVLTPLLPSISADIQFRTTYAVDATSRNFWDPGRNKFNWGENSHYILSSSLGVRTLYASLNSCKPPRDSGIS